MLPSCCRDTGNTPSTRNHNACTCFIQGWQGTWEWHCRTAAPEAVTPPQHFKRSTIQCLQGMRQWQRTWEGHAVVQACARKRLQVLACGANSSSCDALDDGANSSSCDALDAMIPNGTCDVAWCPKHHLSWAAHAAGIVCTFPSLWHHPWWPSSPQQGSTHNYTRSSHRNPPLESERAMRCGTPPLANRPSRLPGRLSRRGSAPPPLPPPPRLAAKLSARPG